MTAFGRWWRNFWSLRHAQQVLWENRNTLTLAYDRLYPIQWAIDAGCAYFGDGWRWQYGRPEWVAPPVLRQILREGRERRRG